MSTRAVGQWPPHSPTTMEASNELLTIAELAVGLAGFAGLVVSFNHRGGLHATDRYRFIALFSLALFAALLAFVPFGFHHAGLASAALWRASSGVILASSVFAAWWLGVYLRPEFAPDENPPKAFSIALFAIPTFNVLLQVANLVGWPAKPGALAYVAGLILWLAVPALIFALLILYREKD